MKKAAPLPKASLAGTLISMPMTVFANGRVTIPKPVRDLLGIGPGSKVEFQRAADGSMVITRSGQS